MVGEKPLEPVCPEFYILFTSVGLAKSVFVLSDINISSIISISSKKVSSFLESVPQQIHKAYRAIKKGSPTFAQYKRQYWREHLKRNLPDLYSREKGTVWRQYEELHHRFIPQRSKWAPNWLKNNRINIKRVSSLEHA